MLCLFADIYSIYLKIYSIHIAILLYIWYSLNNNENYWIKVINFKITKLFNELSIAYHHLQLVMEFMVALFFLVLAIFFLFFHNINNYYSSCNTRAQHPLNLYLGVSIIASGRTNTYPSQTFLKRVANPRLEKRFLSCPDMTKTTLAR